LLAATGDLAVLAAHRNLDPALLRENMVCGELCTLNRTVHLLDRVYRQIFWGHLGILTTTRAQKGPNGNLIVYKARGT
jgi:hypothetical protein